MSFVPCERLPWKQEERSISDPFEAIYPEYESEDVKVCHLATIIQRPEVASDRFAGGESSGKDEEERRPPCSSERRRRSRG
ncbi:hypothetical protein EYF80_009830 [Liparis tanakae]|uniref:Uncharacterized protein n=1 Tax=Liparis tanakae TaxID=230148 RepID=A0A4Z2IRH6_9TELE|nr:hypothetical protein EYF80_009830 [Liparis tanakae]